MKPLLVFVRKHLLPSLGCFAAAFLLLQTELFQRVRNLTRDERTKYRAWLKPTPPAEDVVLIGIDETSLQDLGRWPWSLAVHGDFQQLIGQVKPGVVAWDILFIDANPEDADLAKGILLGGSPVILGAMRGEEGEGIKPTDEAAKPARLEPLRRVEGDRTRIPSSPSMLLPTGSLAQVAALGFTDTPPGPDGARREAPLIVQVGGEVYPTLSLRSLIEYWRARPEDVRVVLGDAITIDAPLARRRIPIDDTGAYYINYRYALEGAAGYGYSAIISRLYRRFVEKEPVDLPSLTGKIVFVGQVADGLIDMGPTPFSPLTPLVLVHVNVVDNILREDYVRVPPASLIWLGGILVGAAGLARFSDRKLREQVVFALGLPIAYWLLATLLWIQGSWLVQVVGPVLGFGSLQVFMIGRRVLSEQRAKEKIKGMFGTYISPALVNRMVESGEAPRLGGHEENITAYFSDIQGFSSFSEQLPPDRLVELMNEYLTACTDIVQEEGGTLDKYIGDAVVAIFGAPIALPDHALRACVASLRVQQRQAELRVKWQGEGEVWPAIVGAMQTRIGLNTGDCTIGNMGSRTRFNYTMMGDNVNLGARMESGAKSWGVYSMCTEATKVACEEHGGDRVVFRPLGRIVVKGRTKPVPVFELVGLKETVTEADRECIGIFTQGLECFYRRDWEGALARFRQSAPLERHRPEKSPGVSTNPSLVYQGIVVHCQQEPPAEGWNGEYVMKEK
jgi:adenylate cyclase